MATNVNIFSQQGLNVAPLTAQERLQNIQAIQAKQAAVSEFERLVPGSTDSSRNIEAEFAGREGSSAFVGPERGFEPVGPMGPPTPTEAQQAWQQNKALFLQDAAEEALRNSDLEGVVSNLDNTPNITGGTVPGRAEYRYHHGLAKERPQSMSSMQRRQSQMLKQNVLASIPRALPGQNYDVMPEQEAWMMKIKINNRLKSIIMFSLLE